MYRAVLRDSNVTSQTTLEKSSENPFENHVLTPDGLLNVQVDWGRQGRWEA